MATDRALTKAGFRVINAHDGEEALELARRVEPAAVILDMMLPKVTGPQVLRQLKHHVLTARIPVLVLTGLSQKNEARLLEDGAAAFLGKNTIVHDPELLLSTLRQIIRESGVTVEAPAFVERKSTLPFSVSRG